MWIVSLALRRPYTFIVLALLIALLGVFTILRTPTDIFPSIKIPVVAVVWRYSGLSPDEMATRLVLGSERSTQVAVNDIEHTESQSLSGVGVVKYFFQPYASEELSYAQITAQSQTGLSFAPPGTTAPYVLAFNASTVPVLQLAMSSEDLSEAMIFDLGQNVLRTALATVPGVTLPWPYGGLQRQVQVDLDPDALRARGLSGNDVTDAIAAQNLILPAGVQKIGDLEYFVALNANPKQIEDLNNIPVATRNGSVIYVRDVAHVRDGYPPQTNIARRDGRRAVVQSILKIGNASTLDIIRGIKERLPRMREALPPSFKIEAIGDQSIFVRGAIDAVVREAVIAAALTALMVLLFLGSWRSTLIIAISIPLSILASIICLSALGETINIMTLGGLALAVGILVDDATVTIENMNWHLERGEDVENAILNGAHEIALPAFVSTLAICIVFVPMFLLAGIARFLFVPLAEAVVFAMLASYLLSRTLVPTLAKYWLRRHEPDASARPGFFARFQARFEQGFARWRNHYRALLERALSSGPRFAVPFLAAMAATAVLAFPMGRYLPGLGQDYFPSVDAGQIRLHLRARTGLRIDQTAALCDQVEDAIRRIIPSKELDTIVDNIGLPNSGINLTYSTSAPIGPNDADIYVSLGRDHHPTDDYVRTLRAKLPQVFPSTLFTFPPADIVSQILNFGLPAPIDVQVTGFNVEANRAVRESAARADAQCAGRRGPARTPGLRPSAARGRCRSQQGGAARRDRARRGLESPHLAVRQLPDDALVLDRSEDRIPVHRHRTDAAVQADLPVRPRGDAAERDRRRRAADALQPGDLPPQRCAGRRQSLRRNACDRHLRSGAGHRSRVRLHADRSADCRDAARRAARFARHRTRPDQDHDRLVPRLVGGPGGRGGADLSADRRQLPVLA